MAKMGLTQRLPMPGTSALLPVLGLGVWDSATSVCANTCATALRNGYRHIDTAQMYRNEAEVGKGVEASGVPRSEVFITTKIFSAGGSLQATVDKCTKSVNLLGGYADLFLIHWPGSAADIKVMWQALEQLHAEGKAKAIGVSNFSGEQIDAMKKYAKIWPPAVNQLELHPWLQQRETIEYCNKHQIVAEAYCPLTRMRKIGDANVVRIAKKCNKTPGQVLIRYCLQKGWVPLPKSDKEHRIQENADVFDFEIDSGDMATLDQREREDGKLCLVTEA